MPQCGTTGQLTLYALTTAVEHYAFVLDRGLASMQHDIRQPGC